MDFRPVLAEFHLIHKLVDQENTTSMVGINILTHRTGRNRARVKPVSWIAHHDDDAAFLVARHQALHNLGGIFLRAMNDRVGQRFCLVISRDLAGALPETFTRELAARGIVCVDTAHTEVADWLGSTGHQAVLARPDRYVFGAADDAAELAALVAALRSG